MHFAVVRRRAPRGYTFDACPGCHQVHAVPRPKSGVCLDCRRVLEGHAQAAIDDAALDRTPVRAGVPPQPHGLPYLGRGGECLQQRFLDLCYATSRPSDLTEPLFDPAAKRLVLPQPPETSHWFPYQPQDFRTFDQATAVALRALYDAVRIALNSAYAAGKADGTNLLAMLSAGELTSAEFERRAGFGRASDEAG